MCLVCKEELAELERLRQSIAACPCPVRVRPPRASYFSEYYQRNRERKLAAARQRHKTRKEKSLAGDDSR